MAEIYQVHLADMSLIDISLIVFSLDDIIGDVDDTGRVLDGENLLPEKRGRSRNRNVAGFYSNWKRK